MLFGARPGAEHGKTLARHADVGSQDILESSAILDELPEVDLFTVSIGDLGAMTMDLSPAVAAAIPIIADLVHQRLVELRAEEFSVAVGSC